MTWYSGHWCMKPTMGWVLTSSGLARGVEKEKFWRSPTRKRNSWW